ncbi:type III secretion protein [Pseudomonas sp. UBA4194]|jgi:type III secretion protein C|uniref:type III secretion protein n=1 Tax=Pseudomonas sp. UBA4194 TaxID=1947317 RepID=UPI0025F73D44|nr:type III secretion protein [Pseudomonas sp. UBA4194]
MIPVRCLRPFKQWAARAWVLATVLCAASSVAAQEDEPWLLQPYDYLVIDQDVRGVLGELGRNLNVPVVMTEQVKGKVHGKLKAGSVHEFISRVTSANGLVWYFDGSTLFVDSDKNLQNRIFDTSRLNALAVDATLQQLAFNGERIAVDYDAAHSVVSVSGPPGYVAMVDQRLAALRPKVSGPGAERGVRVFRGGAEPQVVSQSR